MFKQRYFCSFKVKYQCNCVLASEIQLSIMKRAKEVERSTSNFFVEEDSWRLPQCGALLCKSAHNQPPTTNFGDGQTNILVRQWSCQRFKTKVP